jgi:MT0933-like antitoxin protein
MVRTDLWVVQSVAMGIMDSIKKLTRSKRKIASGVDKATDFVDKKTGGKHHDTLDQVDDIAAKIAGENPT